MAPVDPHDALGWTIVYIGIAFTTFSIVAALKASIWPGERAADHPKTLILKENR
ncbi:MAG: hypothetical protein NVSMB64_10340 [Candidatus Velthaea sp.]